MRQDNHAAMVSNDHTFPVSHPRFVRVAHGGVSAGDINLNSPLLIVRSTHHVVSLRFSHQKGKQHVEQRGRKHDKANAPARGLYC